MPIRGLNLTPDAVAICGLCCNSGTFIKSNQGQWFIQACTCPLGQFEAGKPWSFDGQDITIEVLEQRRRYRTSE